MVLAALANEELLFEGLELYELFAELGLYELFEELELYELFDEEEEELERDDELDFELELEEVSPLLASAMPVMPNMIMIIVTTNRQIALFIIISCTVVFW